MYIYLKHTDKHTDTDTDTDTHAHKDTQTPLIERFEHGLVADERRHMQRRQACAEHGYQHRYQYVSIDIDMSIADERRHMKRRPSSYRLRPHTLVA